MPGTIIKGCRFAERCQDAMGICWDKNPPIVKINEYRSVRCHKYDEGKGGFH